MKLHGNYIQIILIAILTVSIKSVMFAQPIYDFGPRHPFYIIGKIYDNGIQLNTKDNSLESIINWPFRNTGNIDTLNLFVAKGSIPFIKQIHFNSKIICDQNPCSIDWVTVRCYLSFEDLDTFYIDSLYFEPGYYEIIPIKNTPPFIWNKIDFVKCELQKCPSSDSLMAEELLANTSRYFQLAMKEKHPSNTDISYWQRKRENLCFAKCYCESALAIRSSDQQVLNKIHLIDSSLQSVVSKIYHYYIQQGDSLFRKGLFFMSGNEYRAAQHYKSDEVFPKIRLEKIDSIFNENKEELFTKNLMIADSNFWKAEDIHDSIYNLKDNLYERAKTYYSEAGYFSEDHNVYLKQQYDSIKKMRRYLDCIKYADSNFKRYIEYGRISENNFTSLRASYRGSLLILPERKYPIEQIKKVEAFYVECQKK